MRLSSGIAGAAGCLATLALVSCGGGGSSMSVMPTMGMSGYVATHLVSNNNLSTNPYSTSNVDTRLVNPWGIAFNPQGFVWVANNHSSTSTLYDGDGVRQTLVVGDGNPIYVLNGMRQVTLSWPSFDAPAADATGDDLSIKAPIIGRVAKLFVAEGDPVAKGDRVAVVEAMKMEHVLHAPRPGRVSKLAVKEGQQVTLAALIATLAPTRETD